MFVRPFQALNPPLRSATPIEGRVIFVAGLPTVGSGSWSFQKFQFVLFPRWYIISENGTSQSENTSQIRIQVGTTVLHLAPVNETRLFGAVRSEKTNCQLEQKHHQITPLLISSYGGDLKRTLHILKRIDRDMNRGFDLGWLEALLGGEGGFLPTLFPRPEIPDDSKSHPCRNL